MMRPIRAYWGGTVLLIAALSQPALSQPALGQTPAPAQIQQPVPADIQQRTTAARSLLQVTRLDVQLSQSLNTSVDQRIAALRRVIPAGLFVDGMVTRVNASKPAVVATALNAATQLYARNMTVLQIQAAITFYQSQAGQRMQAINSGGMRQVTLTALRELDRNQAIAASQLCPGNICPANLKPGLDAYTRALNQAAPAPAPTPRPTKP